MRVLLRLLIILAVPIVLTMTMVRLLTLPWYPAWEYSRSNFPEDPFGMPTAERLRLAQATIRFLNIPGPTPILEDLTFSDGTPAYVERELDHMDDVKTVYNGLTLLALVLLVAAVGAGRALARRGGAGSCPLWAALTQGGIVTLVLLLGLGAWMLVGFNAFFTLFHGLFFEPGTWIFYDSDTLIRLFPLQFWQDAGLIIAGGVSLIALLLVVVGSGQQRRCRRADGAPG